MRGGAPGADRRALAAGGGADAPRGAHRRPSDDRDGELHPLDGSQAALPLGIQDAGSGGVGFDSSATVLPDLLVRAPAGRVDGAQAHPADRRGDRRGADARVDLQGHAREALSSAGGENRLDSDRGRREVSDRLQSGCPGGEGARARWAPARPATWCPEGACAGSLADDAQATAGNHANDPPPLRRGQGRGAEAHLADRRASAALGLRGAAPGCAGTRQGARAGREGEAQGGWQARAAHRPLREGPLADSSDAWRANRSQTG